MALAGALCAVVHTITGFTNRRLRAQVATSLGEPYMPRGYGKSQPIDGLAVADAALRCVDANPRAPALAETVMVCRRTHPRD